MSQTINININKRFSKLTDGLRPLVELLYQLNNVTSENTIVDLCNAKFVSPLFVTTVQVIADKFSKPLSFINHSDYMYNVYAHNPVNPSKMRKSEFIALMAKYEKKTYIPIVCFPTGSETDSKDGILRVIESLIINQAKIPSNVAQG